MHGDEELSFRLKVREMFLVCLNHPINSCEVTHFCKGNFPFICHKQIVRLDRACYNLYQSLKVVI